MRKLLIVLAVGCGQLSAQTLKGVVDIHAHCDPDSMPRSIDAIDLAKLARDRGIRALVLKNHYEPTASLAFLVRKVVPGIELFGGIALNRTVGGVNPAAVESMTRMKGGWGRVVWMPTFDAENQVRYSKESRPFVPVSKNGTLLPEVREVLARVPRDVTIVMIEHDMDSALAFAERITLLHYGEVIVEGTRAEVVADPRTKEVYLGE
jgi:hypothetical protein